MRKSKQQKLVEYWNLAHPTGTEVRRYKLMRPRSGDYEVTATTCPAWLLGGHTAVVKVVGVSGCVAIESLEEIS